MHCPAAATVELLYRSAQELQDCFRFTQYLLISAAYRDPQAPSEEPAPKPAKQPKKRPKVCFV